jgi:hypothetical protein
MDGIHVAAFQKYNNTIGIIGFPPSVTLIIGQYGNLDAARTTHFCKPLSI